jgi:site-specific recombinase XerD
MNRAEIINFIKKPRGTVIELPEGSFIQDVVKVKNELVIPNDFKIPKSIKDLTPQQINSCLALNNILAARNIVIRAGIDFDSKVKQFLETYNDKGNTSKTYRAGINKYILFCKETGIEPAADSSYETARNFKHYLESKGFSNKTINLYTTAIRLLFQFIIDNDEYMESMKNPFYQKKLNKNGRELKKQKELLSYDEELKVLEYFKKNNDYLYNTLYYQINFGVRIDSFSKITKIDKNNSLAYYVSKGKECLTPIKIRNSDSVKFSELVKRWKAQGAHNLNVMMNRGLETALNELNITKHITSHCIRHTFVQELNDMNVDGVSISRLVNHRDLSSKDSYLTSKKQQNNSWEGLTKLRNSKRKNKK